MVIIQLSIIVSKIHTYSNIFSVVESLFHDHDLKLIELLPTNCKYAIEILKRNQNLAKIGSKFEVLSEKFADHETVYEHLLPYIFKKCGYNVLKLFETLECTIKDNEKIMKFKKFKTGKRCCYC